jgi:beta-galactosidase
MRERISFNEGWRFAKGDPMWIQPHLDYEAIKPWFLASSAPLRGMTSPRPARPPGDLATHLEYVLPDYDDTSWRMLDLPHDWGVEGPFRQDLPGATGKLPWAGIGWYRKRFALPAGDAGRRLVLEVDGAMSYALVWCNGQFVGGWPHGYTSFQLGSHAVCPPRAGERPRDPALDNPPDSSRWYPGGGLYRNVWLTKTDPVHIAPWGVFVSTPRVSPESAIVSVQVVTENETGSTANLALRNEIYELDPDGRTPGAAVSTSRDIGLEIPPHRQAHRMQELAIDAPRLWAIASPSRYAVVTTVLRDGQVVDRLETPFGIRSIAFDAARGFLLNGARGPAPGACACTATSAHWVTAVQRTRDRAPARDPALDGLQRDPHVAQSSGARVPGCLRPHGLSCHRRGLRLLAEGEGPQRLSPAVRRLA